MKIWKLYQSTYPEAKEWSLRIIGNGNCASDYQYWVEKNNVPNIYFEGQVDDTIEFYLSAAVFMMTSDSEGWGLTLMEAQQMGCVPIAFNSYESIREIIQDGVNGFLVKEMNIEDFVEKLHILTINTDIRTSMAVNGLEVINRFSVNRMIGKWLDILQQFKG